MIVLPRPKNRVPKIDPDNLNQAWTRCITTAIKIYKLDAGKVDRCMTKLSQETYLFKLFLGVRNLDEKIIHRS